MELKKRQIVTSRAGRDINRSYVVMGFENELVLLANGKKFTADIPKKKNIRHLVATKTVLQETEIADNQVIIQALQAFDAARKADLSGG